MWDLLKDIAAYLQQLNMVSVFLRILLAAVGGSVIGLNRGKAGQPAGMRTHMLVCIGSALVMLTGQYVFELYGGGDPARLGAQVISGIGFLGAGSIIVSDKGKGKVKGLTTAAGLWASACIGLAVGVGFYSAAIITTLVVSVVLARMKDLERRLVWENVQFRLYMQMNEADMGHIMDNMHDMGLEIDDISVMKKKKSGVQKVVLYVRNTGKDSRDEIMRKLEHVEEIQYVNYSTVSEE